MTEPTTEARARTQERWHQLIYGSIAGTAPPATLDDIRTTTILLGNGITPAARGAGGTTRRVIGVIDRDAARLGVGALLRDMYGYWSLVGALRAPWPEIARAIEEEMRLQAAC
ncbi:MULTISPECIES: hypothetical protein [Streptomyces]|uniref:Uncharacterized protein n=1 Tax=Streptomyces spinosisporus TaxID=2927582 RepID=A0ABS9XET2_9ACTN|nr:MULTISPECIES: hypothetical protein [Streptomyces]MCI3240602.1 hypothetical protein [Streptomyces spinosisporus]WUB37239.1 hypothetical protein OHN38_20945 [Streptomyces sp. NBC_00588]